MHGMFGPYPGGAEWHGLELSHATQHVHNLKLCSCLLMELSVKYFVIVVD